jgi:tetratricopeptide (TPR) repeat protein
MSVRPPPLLRDRQFAKLLCTSGDETASGILTASRGKLRRLFCLSKGWIVFATSNLLEEQFLEYLVRSGAVDEGLHLEIVEEALRANTKPVAYLLAMGKLPADELRRGMEGLIQELATSTLEWPDGTFTFEDGLPRLEGEITGRLAARSLVLAHARRYPSSLDALRVRIGPPDLRPVAEPTDDDGTHFDALGAYLISRCDGTNELSAIVAASPAAEEPTLRAIYGFLLAGILHPEDPQTRRERESKDREDALSREECLGRLAMAVGQDHYGVLGVDRMSRARAIREAYYGLARRYHPDRFRSGSLSDLLPQFEDFFMLVTDAYNTLSDRERRAEYDAELAASRGTQDNKGADTAYLARQNFLRARALAAQRKYTEAVTFFENAVSLDPGQAEFHLELGVVLSRNPRHREEAERHLLAAIQLSPAAVNAYVVLGQLYRKAGRLGRAGRMAREALRWEPGHLEASQLLAEAGDAPDERDELHQGVFRSS